MNTVYLFSFNIKLFHYFMKILLTLVSQVHSKDQCPTAQGGLSFQVINGLNIWYLNEQSKFQKYRQHTAKIKAAAQETVATPATLSVPPAKTKDSKHHFPLKPGLLGETAPG